MTPEEKHARRLAQKRASYARLMADPAYRSRRAEYGRKHHLALHGPSKRADLSGFSPAERHTRKLEQQRASRQRHRDDPARRAKLREHEKDPARVADKRRWRQEHAADLNARRAKDRAENPQKYRQRERAYKARRRAARRLAKTTVAAELPVAGRPAKR